MELLLNLLWLSLALPALMLSHRGRKAAEDSGQVCRINVFIVVVCLLLLLFPVISATDDLMAVGLEMEESGATKCLLKQSTVAKAPIAGDGFGAPAHPLRVSLVVPHNELIEAVLTFTAVLPQFDAAHASDCRAPPCPEFSASVVPSRTARLLIFKLDFTLQSRVVLNSGLQAGSPQASVAPDGLGSFKCIRQLFSASGNFFLASRNRDELRHRLPRFPTNHLMREEESS